MEEQVSDKDEEEVHRYGKEAKDYGDESLAKGE